MPKASIDPMLAPAAPAGMTGRMGAYSLVAPIGAGGMGAVYLARKLGIDEADRYAIKVMLPHLTGDERFSSLFLHEARIATRIRHPNVCRVIDYGSEDGTYYIAMEHLRGRPLSAVLTRVCAAPPDDVDGARRVLMTILAGVARGLEHAHELVDDEGRPMRVVHRDVCPPNLFVTEEGVAKILDFGIALYADRSFRTSTGEMKGHLAYIAPELLSGMRAERSADVWSLAAIAWEAIARTRLFRRDSEAATINAVLHDAVPRLSSLCPGVPPAVDDAIARGLTRERTERETSATALMRSIFDAFGFEPAPASEVGAALARWIPADTELSLPALPDAELSTVHARAVDPAADTRLQVPRRRAAPWIAAAAGLTVAALAGGAYWWAADEPPAQHREQLPVLATRAPAEQTPEAPEAAPAEPVEPEKATRTPRPRRPRARPGELIVPPGDGWSEVWVDGERLGFSPLARDLPAGRHRVSLRRDGEVIERRTLTIRPGRRTILRPEGPR